MAFYDRLKEARINSGLTQEHLAEKLGIAKSTLSGYESGNREPTVATIAKVLDILGIDANYLYQDEMDALGGSPMILKYDETKHIEKYRDLDDRGKKTVDYILDNETERVKQLRETGKNSFGSSSTRIYLYVHKIACAGTGFYFDDIPTDTIELPFVPGADFVIGVNGDSMEPDYHDGELVYVEKVPDLAYGEVGIFTIGNECYLKEYSSDGLKSWNPEYDDIPGNEDIRLVGKVIGKVAE